MIGGMQREFTERIQNTKQTCGAHSNLIETAHDNRGERNKTNNEIIRDETRPSGPQLMRGRGMYSRE